MVRGWVGGGIRARVLGWTEDWIGVKTWDGGGVVSKTGGVEVVRWPPAGTG